MRLVWSRARSLELSFCWADQIFIFNMILISIQDTANILNFPQTQIAKWVKRAAAKKSSFDRIWPLFDRDSTTKKSQIGVRTTTLMFVFGLLPLQTLEFTYRDNYQIQYKFESNASRLDSTKLTVSLNRTVRDYCALLEIFRFWDKISPRRCPI